MNGEVLRAHAATLAEWANQYEHDGCAGAPEMSFLLMRASRLALNIASGAPIAIEDAPKRFEAVEEPKDD